MENENILELTEENLIKCGIDIKHLINTDSNPDNGFLLGKYLITYSDNTIFDYRNHYICTYDGIKKPIFPFYDLDLIEDYYKCKLRIYLKKENDNLGSSFDEDDEKETFKQKELQECDDAINHYSNMFKNHPWRLEEHRAVYGKQAYKKCLNRLNQNETIDKSKEIAVFLEPKYILGLNEAQISKSYIYFKDSFKPLLTYKDYLDCFDETQTPKHPKLIKGQNKIFVYFLCEAGIKGSIAIERFGIKSFDTTKSRNIKINPPSIKIVSDIQSLLKL